MSSSNMSIISLVSLLFFAAVLVLQVMEMNYFAAMPSIWP